jgi:hypothetical protein
MNLKNRFVKKNNKSNFNSTLQDCSLAKGLPKLFKTFNSMQNSGCQDNKNEVQE